VKRLGFTHVEFMPVMEHPFFGSWGYQTTGYFAPTCRYGSPQDFKLLVDHLHQQGIGVILDWVPSHFPSDEHGLAYFDGTHLYEHADPRQRVQPDWNSYVFNYGRSEVRSFLISSAMYTATWEVIYFGGFMPDFVPKYQEHVLASARANGATQAELDKKTAELQSLAEKYKNPVFNAGFTLLEPLPLGLVIALISAVVVSRRRRPEGAMAAVT